jgi:hypothetical protein
MVAGLTEIVGQRRAQVFFIFDYQDGRHRVSSVRMMLELAISILHPA